MGPILLFDKSFLQSLSVDESVWLDNFYITNICPLFYVETLSDLEKAVRDGRTPEQEVRIIAAKAPEMHVSANMFHHELCLGDLLGQTITMDGRPVIPGGKPVKSKNKKGFVFEPSPEAEAFSRWQKEEFHEIERKYAKNWRKAIEGLDFKEVLHWLNSVGIKENNCKTLEEAKDYALSIVNGRNNPLNRMKFVFSILSMPPKYFIGVYNRWGGGVGLSTLERFCTVCSTSINNRIIFLHFCFFEFNIG